MVEPICLQRHIDVNQTSGTGLVWEGCIFSNGWVAGMWLTNTPSYGWYPSIEHVEFIHGHDGKTEIISGVPAFSNDNRKYVLLQAKDSATVTDENDWIAEGMEFNNGWIALLQLAKYTSVYWYRNLEELEFVVGKRSNVIFNFALEMRFLPGEPVWQREKIFRY